MLMGFVTLISGPLILSLRLCIPSFALSSPENRKIVFVIQRNYYNEYHICIFIAFHLNKAVLGDCSDLV
jgi:hypothetical protein